MTDSCWGTILSIPNGGHLTPFDCSELKRCVVFLLKSGVINPLGAVATDSVRYLPMYEMEWKRFKKLSLTFSSLKNLSSKSALCCLSYFFSSLSLPLIYSLLYIYCCHPHTPSSLYRFPFCFFLMSSVSFLSLSLFSPLCLSPIYLIYMLSHSQSILTLPNVPFNSSYFLLLYCYLSIISMCTLSPSPPYLQS